MHSKRAFIRLTLLATALPMLLAAGNVASDGNASHSPLNEALTAANRIDEGLLKAHTLCLIATAQAKAGNITAARQTADAISIQSFADSPVSEAKVGWKNEVYAVIAGCQAAAADIKGANATVSQIPGGDARGTAYQYISQALSLRGDIVGAREWATHANGINRTRAEAAIAEAEAGGGDLSGALQMVADLNDPGEQVEAYALIAETQVKRENIKGARQTLALAKAAAAQVPEWVARGPYGVLAMALVKAGDLDEARCLSKADTSYISREIAIAQGDMKDLTAAKATLEQITDPCSLACANASVAKAEQSSGDASAATTYLGAARAAASSITDSKERAEACADIADVMAQMGYPSEAADWARSQADPFVEISALIGATRAVAPSTGYDR